MQSCKRLTKKQLLPWLAVAVWAVLIFYFSAQPSLSTNLGVWDYVLRKMAHVVEFAILCFLIWTALRQHRISDAKAMTTAAAAALLYAATDEIHQHFVPGRDGTLRDMGFDLAGILIAVAAAVYLLRRNRNEKYVTRT